MTMFICDSWWEARADSKLFTSAFEADGAAIDRYLCTDERNGKVWKYRPFTRVIKGYRPYRIVRDYIQLNECEVNGRPYSKTRLLGFSQEQLQELWI